jgi:hypothetical protein
VFFFPRLFLPPTQGENQNEIHSCKRLVSQLMLMVGRWVGVLHSFNTHRAALHQSQPRENFSFSLVT